MFAPLIFIPATYGDCIESTDKATLSTKHVVASHTRLQTQDFRSNIFLVEWKRLVARECLILEVTARLTACYKHR
jgi:hypothetical protein